MAGAGVALAATALPALGERDRAVVAASHEIDARDDHNASDARLVVEYEDAGTNAPLI
jgi:hypothetical protein